MKFRTKLVTGVLLAVSAVLLPAQEPDPWNAGEAFGARPPGPTSPASPREVNPVTPVRQLNAPSSTRGEDVGVDGAQLDARPKKPAQNPREGQTEKSPLCFQPGAGWIRRAKPEIPDKSEGAIPVSSLAAQRSRTASGHAPCLQMTMRSDAAAENIGGSARDENGVVRSVPPARPSLRPLQFSNRASQGRRSPIRSVVPPVATERSSHGELGGFRQMNGRIMNGSDASVAEYAAQKKQIQMPHRGSKRHRRARK